MNAAEYDLDTQRNYWNSWNSRKGYPHDQARRRARQMLVYLESLALENPSILDLGCGMGWFAEQLARYGPTTGVDLSEDAIVQARASYPDVNFVVGDALNAGLPEQSFDVVVSQEVIAHVPSQAQYIRCAASLLKPHGYLILTTPNRFVHERVNWPTQPRGHIEKWLSRRELKRLLNSHFAISRATTVFPMGHRGILRVVNSIKLSTIAERILPGGRVDRVKEWAGFGWTQVVLARKR